MSSPPQYGQGTWKWDPSRRAHFYYSPQEQCFIYEDGTRLPWGGNGYNAANQAQTNPTGYNSSGYDAPHTRVASYGDGRNAGDQTSYVDSVTSGMSRLSVTQGSTQTFNSSGSPTATVPDDSEYQGLATSPVGLPAITSQTYDARGTYRTPQNYSAENYSTQNYPTQNYSTQNYSTPQNYSAQNYSTPQNYRNSHTYAVQPYQGHTGNQAGTTYQASVAHQPSAQISGSGRQDGETRIIRANPGHQEKLHSSFYERYPAWFEVGKVFRTAWVEPEGSNAAPTNASLKVWEDINVHSKIQWFAVIKNQNAYYCICLPINTYGGRGVGIKKANPSDHSIIYTTSTPRLHASESKVRADMLKPVRVIPTNAGDQMDPMSRLNFAKVYNVQKNIKVEDFGSIDPRDLHLFKSQFKDVWNRDDNE